MYIFLLDFGFLDFGRSVNANHCYLR
ncbi:hypothetical protein CBM2599_B120002 [Cupriavidus taiwanensis]|nr:hypothetical protein CBM2599_B120002 [Cupriavidus taiwanensis]SOY98202.1 hypothetical protein CBM2600_B130003 [Cupriavidus taiwanensis]